VCVVHTPETAAPIKRAGTTSVIKVSSRETILRTSVVVSPHRRRGQRRYSKCVSAKQSARYFLYYSSLMSISRDCGLIEQFTVATDAAIN